MDALAVARLARAGGSRWQYGKRAAATTYAHMGVFNRAHKDILGMIAALRQVHRQASATLLASAHQGRGQQLLRAAAGAASRRTATLPDSSRGFLALSLCSSAMVSLKLLNCLLLHHAP